MAQMIECVKSSDKTVGAIGAGVFLRNTPAPIENTLSLLQNTLSLFDIAGPFADFFGSVDLPVPTDEILIDRYREILKIMNVSPALGLSLDIVNGSFDSNSLTHTQQIIDQISSETTVEFNKNGGVSVINKLSNEIGNGKVSVGVATIAYACAPLVASAGKGISEVLKQLGKAPQ